MAASLIEKYENPKLRRPSRPSESTKIAYNSLTPTRYLTYSDIIGKVPANKRAQLSRAVSMEELPINNGSGQSFGYIIYRKVTNINNGDRYKVSEIKKEFLATELKLRIYRALSHKMSPSY